MLERQVTFFLTHQINREKPIVKKAILIQGMMNDKRELGKDNVK